ncbi:MAG: hypothetical protein ACR652_22250 [Methylocystis sp.]|uniref:hypothetical protein n=1 Tax=Methylocystis sp. TaxID=1911079 RepID=UPI003DA44062
MTGRAAAALFLAVCAFAAAALLWRMEPQTLAYGWLASVLTWISAPLGCLGLLLIHAMTGGRWGDAIKPELRAGAATLLLLPAFALPLIPFARRLYPWLREGGGTLPNAFYLNGSAALARALIYLLVWFGLEWIVARRLRRPDPQLAAIAPAGLILLALTISFMSIDLVMSLDPRFPSSVFGLLRMADMALFALSLCVFIASTKTDIQSDDLHQLGRLLLAAVILWAYLAFMELLIVWQSNLPAEASWYGPRLTGGWGVLGAAVTVFRFALPFFVLLSPRAQSSPRAMRDVAATLILAGCASNLWLVGPQSAAPALMIVLSFLVTLGGMAAASFALMSAWRAPALRMDRP